MTWRLSSVVANTYCSSLSEVGENFGLELTWQGWRDPCVLYIRSTPARSVLDVRCSIVMRKIEISVRRWHWLAWPHSAIRLKMLWGPLAKTMDCTCSPFSVGSQSWEGCPTVPPHWWPESLCLDSRLYNTHTAFWGVVLHCETQLRWFFPVTDYREAIPSITTLVGVSMPFAMRDKYQSGIGEIACFFF